MIITKEKKYQANEGLSRVFYVPEMASMMEFYEHYMSVDSSIRYGKAGKFCSVLVSLHFQDYLAQHVDYDGIINLNGMLKQEEKLQNFFKQKSIFSSPYNYFGLRYYPEIVKPRIGKATPEAPDGTVAVFKSKKFIVDSDNDPYQTAGGYRTWQSKEHATMYLSLNRDNSMVLRYEASCLVDHYNNNYCGNSTGGGTTKYKEGERVGTRVILLPDTMSFDDLIKSDEYELVSVDFDYGLEVCEANLETYKRINK